MIGTVASMAILSQAVTVPMWAPKGVADDADSHVAFRSKFSCLSGKSRMKIVGASEYLVWLDGQLIHDGPARYASGFPEYQTVPLTNKTGVHDLAIQVRNAGVTTRILSAIKPFLWCVVEDGDQPVRMEWQCARLPGYRPRAQRISDILGWTDWVDTREALPYWQIRGSEGAQWQSPVEAKPDIGPITEAKTAPVRLITLPIKPISSGGFTVTYGYESDDPAVRFFLDDLNPKGVPPQGVWRRYDLGRVRLGRPKFTMDLPKGAIVEFAMCEQLQHGRVHPWLNLSGSRSSNMDNFVASGGGQEFMPFTPKGGRFLEVHIKTDGPVRFVKEEFLERTFFSEPVGSFDCDDQLLNKIWKVGVDTVRACSEDALVDCPTRERGQWTGDVASVATDIVNVAFGDLSLSRRALVQAAQAARADGLVAGVGPGDPGYLSTYAAQWVTACVHYWEMTGDMSLLQELHQAAKKNMTAFQAKMTPNGLTDDLGWGFVDWGYVRNEGPSDIALNIHYLMALRSMDRWERAMNSRDQTYQDRAAQLEAIVKKWLTEKLSKAGGWKNVGYQRASLALLADLVPNDQIKPCIATVKQHLLSCFPNNPKGPRLSDPGVANEQVMTPYFCHFAFAALLNHGEVDFVLGQYRKCWGWALGDNRTTWLEVFDTRWSHCHEWSGCPTWQLSQYVLGFRPRFDLEAATYEVDLQPGTLKRASGAIPMPTGDTFKVDWTRATNGIRLKISTPKPISLRIGERTVKVQSKFDEVLEFSHGR